MYKKSYTMYKRFSKKRGKKVFYVRFLDSEGNRLPARNSECTSKSAAEFWAVEQLKNGITQIIKPKIETFEDFSQYFFIPGKCPYLKSLEDRQELKPAYIEKQRWHLVRDVLPYFNDKPLIDIQVSNVEAWIQKLKDLRGPVVANRSRVTLKVIFNEAVRLGKRKTNPMDLVKKFRENPKDKGILTLSEARQLFCPDALDTIWNGELLHFTINLLGATCGLRMGETQGIQVIKVMSNHILINEAWGRNHGLLACKTSGSKRSVPIPGYLKGHINQLIQGPRIRLGGFCIFNNRRQDKTC